MSSEEFDPNKPPEHLTEAEKRHWIRYSNWHATLNAGSDFLRYVIDDGRRRGRKKGVLMTEPGPTLRHKVHL